MKNQILHKTPVIKCPHCGAEYLPGEIYMPGALIGKPVDIVKDSFGKILYEDYESELTAPDMIEHFTCEFCEKPFVVEATIAYKAKMEAPERDFSTQYVSLLD
jgi:predicted nucleic-acid-binding Zn-ribbon protein